MEERPQNRGGHGFKSHNPEQIWITLELLHHDNFPLLPKQPEKKPGYVGVRQKCRLENLEAQYETPKTDTKPRHKSAIISDTSKHPNARLTRPPSRSTTSNRACSLVQTKVQIHSMEVSMIWKDRPHSPT